MLISQSMDDRNGAFVMMSFWMIWLLLCLKMGTLSTVVQNQKDGWGGSCK